MTFTHPGKFGDLLWALPTVKALGGGDLWLPAALRSMWEFLEAQPYIGRMTFDHGWVVQDTAPATPRTPEVYLPGATWHLGYPDWPDRPLPEYVAAQFGVEIDLGQPWLTVPPDPAAGHHYRRGKKDIDVLGHFTDRWFELKYGCWQLLCNHLLTPRAGKREPTLVLGYASGSRWLHLEAATHPYCGEHVLTWVELAQYIQRSRLVVTDNSAVMVLCAGLQTTPCLVLEPEEARHHPIFWPGIQGGPDGPDRWKPREPLCRWIHPLLGGDGRPTFDSRHLIETVQRMLSEQAGEEADHG